MRSGHSPPRVFLFSLCFAMLAGFLSVQVTHGSGYVPLDEPIRLTTLQSTMTQPTIVHVRDVFQQGKSIHQARRTHTIKAVNMRTRRNIDSFHRVKVRVGWMYMRSGKKAANKQRHATQKAKRHRVHRFKVAAGTSHQARVRLRVFYTQPATDGPTGKATSKLNDSDTSGAVGKMQDRVVTQAWQRMHGKRKTKLAHLAPSPAPPWL